MYKHNNTAHQHASIPFWVLLQIAELLVAPTRILRLQSSSQITIISIPTLSL